MGAVEKLLCFHKEDFDLLAKRKPLKALEQKFPSGPTSPLFEI
jgi:hypothetical protein